MQALNAQLAQRPAGKRNVFVFVHGFNTLFAEAAYTATQLIHDSGAPAVPVLFTWASRGEPLQYVYDTNSATVARDSLEHTLKLVMASNAEKVNILAHSMGNWVTVEALRQAKLQGGGAKYADKIGLVVLASPDLDMDVFKSELRAFGKVHKPFYVVLSRDDKALGLSNFIAGGQGRVGNTTDTAELTELGATVIDLTDVTAMDSANHGKFMELAAVGPQLREVLAGGIHSSAPRAARDGDDFARQSAWRADQDRQRAHSGGGQSLSGGRLRNVGWLPGRLRVAFAAQGFLLSLSPSRSRCVAGPGLGFFVIFSSRKNRVFSKKSMALWRL